MRQATEGKLLIIEAEDFKRLRLVGVTAVVREFGHHKTLKNRRMARDKLAELLFVLRINAVQRQAKSMLFHDGPPSVSDVQPIISALYGRLPVRGS